MRHFALALILVLAPLCNLHAQGMGVGGGNVGVHGGGGGNTVTLQGCATKQYKTTNTTQSYTGVTVSSGTDLALTVTLNWDIAGGSTRPSSVSVVWDAAGANQSFSNIVHSALTVGPGAEIWGLVNPTPGASKTITITYTTTAPVFIDACAWTNVVQSSFGAAFPNSTVGSSAATVTVTSATGDKVIACASSGSAFSGITGTLIYNDSASGSQINAFSNYDVGSASVVIGNANAVNLIVGADIAHD